MRISPKILLLLVFSILGNTYKAISLELIANDRTITNDLVIDGDTLVLAPGTKINILGNLIIRSGGHLKAKQVKITCKNLHISGSIDGGNIELTKNLIVLEQSKGFITNVTIKAKGQITANGGHITVQNSLLKFDLPLIKVLPG